MKGQLEAIKLLRAEIYLSDGRESQAALLMDECREKILAERQEKLELYCYYQYLRLILRPDSTRRNRWSVCLENIWRRIRISIICS